MATQASPTRPAVRRIVLVAFPGAQILDVTGPAEVFATAGRMLAEAGRAREAAYAVEMVASQAGPLATSAGIEIRADRSIDAVTEPVDTLIVCGGEGTAAAARDRALIRWIRARGPRVRRLASVCSGAFLLAEAGLLDGRRATTHWRSAALLAKLYPKVSVDADPIFIRDGSTYTSAGVCAGMDLALALVEEDLGRDIALATARHLVIYLKRPGGQSQFSAPLAGQLAEPAPLRELQAWVMENPGAELSVEALAARMAMSPRNFARVFAREVGTTPARWVERARVEVARRQLEETDASVEHIARGCGFGTAETMRRSFLRGLRVSPTEYRSRFRTEDRVAV